MQTHTSTDTTAPLLAAPYLTLHARVLVEDENGDLVDGALPEGESGLIHIPFEDFEHLTGEDAHWVASGLEEDDIFNVHVQELTQCSHAPSWMHDFSGTLALTLQGADKDLAPEEPSSIADMTVTFVLASITKAEDGTIIKHPIPDGDHDDITLSLRQMMCRGGDQLDDLVATLHCRELSGFYLDSILKFSAAPKWARKRYAELQSELGELWFLKIPDHLSVTISEEDYAAIDAAYAALN
jgi:hypothetical protein